MVYSDAGRNILRPQNLVVACYYPNSYSYVDPCSFFASKTIAEDPVVSLFSFYQCWFPMQFPICLTLAGTNHHLILVVSCSNPKDFPNGVAALASNHLDGVDSNAIHKLLNTRWYWLPPNFGDPLGIFLIPYSIDSYAVYKLLNTAFFFSRSHPWHPLYPSYYGNVGVSLKDTTPTASQGCSRRIVINMSGTGLDRIGGEVSV